MSYVIRQKISQHIPVNENTIQQPEFIIKIYFKLGESDSGVRRKFRKEL